MCCNDQEDMQACFFPSCYNTMQMYIIYKIAQEKEKNPKKAVEKTRIVNIEA
jgi:hypothetical protein